MVDYYKLELNCVGYELLSSLPFLPEKPYLSVLSRKKKKSFTKAGSFMKEKKSQIYFLCPSPSDPTV